MIRFDPSRLHQDLLNTGLQNKDNPLYQVIKRIIDALKQATIGVNENSVSIQNNTTVVTSSSSGSSRPSMGETIVIEEHYHMTGSGTSSGSSTPTTYSSLLTNGDPVSPELVFDSYGDVIVVDVPL